MQITTQAFHVTKRGNKDAEYEDAFFPDAIERNLSEFRCAVADGASESAFASEWAQQLVRSFGCRQLRLAELRKEWQKSISGQSLPWFLEKKVRKGAFAAFIG